MKSPHELASMLGVSPELLPVLPELLADIAQLGSWPDRIAGLFAGADLPENSELIELGCGKGAVMIQIAKRLSRRITGVDAFAPFLQEARSEAERAGVAHLCTFVENDIEAVVRSPGRIYDGVVLAAVGALGESYVETVDKLRRVVRSGGYILIDDGYLTRGGGEPHPGYEYCRDHEETTRQLTAHGDRILQEILVPKEELIAYNARNNEVIGKRAAAIIERAPELRSAVESFVRSEAEECEFMETHTEAAIWLLQKK